MYLDELNESQREAVLCIDAPSLVIAGAGSGKTRVLTYKIAYLLEQGMKPWNILALTFTNKAANEMRQRISTLVGQESASGLWMGTFHSIFCRILRIECERICFSSNFTIYDAADSKSLIKKIISEMGLDEKKYKPSAVAAYISNAKNALLSPSVYRQSAELRRRDNSMHLPSIGDIYERYFQRCKLADAMDFDDLLLYTWKLFSDHQDIREKYAERFHFVLVDEYQDTNYAQHQIVWLLTKERQRVCVVGDDAQSIYSFRGAEVDNILNIQQMYSDSRLFKLEQNYRSSQNIVLAANSLIRHNQRQIHKEIFSENEVGEFVKTFQAYSDADEAYLVVREINNFLVQYRIAYKDMAVLYRTNAQSRSLEEAFRKASVPYVIYGGLSFYQRKEIKDVIAYFRLAVNPHDEEALRRVINYPARGIGETTMGKVYQCAIDKGISPWEVLHNTEYLDVSKATKTKLAVFVSLIEKYHEMSAISDAYTVGLELVRESGLQADIFHAHNTEDITKQENLQELLDGISSFVRENTEQGLNARMTDYLQEVSLLSDVDKEENADEDHITLMTVHAAKGLEFKCVFVVGMEESLFPSQMSMDSPRQIEEERRLFYVAMTRARHHLILTYAKSRMRYGKIESFRPSRFLSEIDPRYIKQSGVRNNSSSSFTEQRSQSRFYPLPITQRPTRTETPLFSQPKSQPSSISPQRLTRVTNTTQTNVSNSSLNSNITVGCRVVHERFGQGEVIRLEGTGMDAKATVQFDNVGTKQLLLRFAKIRVL